MDADLITALATAAWPLAAGCDGITASPTEIFGMLASRSRRPRR